MDRRCFLLSLTTIVATAPLPVLAQRGRQSAIGILVLGNPDPAFFLDVFRGEMAKLGYVDGRNCRYEIRSAQGNLQQLPGAAAELAKLPLDVIVTWLTPTAIAARNATKDIPIVMASAGDPVATGLVESLSHPGGNLTGTSAMAAEITAKNVELLREMIPNLSRIAVLANSADPFQKPFVAAIKGSTDSLGLALEQVAATPADDPEPLIRLIHEKKVDAVIVQPTLLQRGLSELFLKYRLPTASVATQFPRDGGLLAYSANAPSLWRQSAGYVDRILRGERPANLPIAQPTDFDLVVNLKTAQSLGMTIAPSFLARADEVIE
jgi:putative ABC transport system substrate-binding protein